MPKKKTPELDPKEQFKRFQEAAKELEVDKSGSAFEATFSKIARGKPSGAATAKSPKSGRSRQPDADLAREPGETSR